MYVQRGFLLLFVVVVVVVKRVRVLTHNCLVSEAALSGDTLAATAQQLDTVCCMENDRKLLQTA